MRQGREGGPRPADPPAGPGGAAPPHDSYTHYRQTAAAPMGGAPEGGPKGRPRDAGAGRRGGRLPGGITLPDIPLLRSRGVVIGAIAAAVLLVVGGGTAFAMDQRITLSVDGERTTVHTYGATVQDVLDSAGVTLGEHDAVAPALDTELGQGDSVLVRSGRELTLTVDGESERHWVTALTVGEALRQIGVSPESMELSVEADKAIPDSGLEVEATAARRVVILRDRVRIETATTAGTVAEVLEANGITLGEHDTVEPERGAEPTDGMVIDVTQILSEPKTEEVPIEAEVEERENPDLPEGEEKVVKKPEDGVKKVTTATIMEQGVETEHVIKEEVVKKPVKGITEIGTKPEEPQIDASAEASSLNWAALAECESGGDPTAVNPAGYYGLYQFSMSTWQSAGGTGNPAEAPASEQTMRAQKLYDMVGGNWQGQWPECGVHLFD
ncbi:resuscitation-promoting factor [Streptomonospora litoralis]|uniref:Resuscitation-promoting factor Rpf2 n=1 Tax=Streptomonospora litoralis TaxID=2498135 RepID=A0A4P6Q5E9_9ACTN|nr:resuscitation-promoting factor [Streptomonospora litoralis]QBI55843.1 Resuscitation-promoting factor Rpf2 precursor [Streptomonospora litoralis]